MNDLKKMKIWGIVFFLGTIVSVAEACQKEAWKILKSDYVIAFTELSLHIDRCKKCRGCNESKFPVPLPNPSGIAKYKTLFLKKAKKLGVQKKELKTTLIKLTREINRAQIKAFWHNKRLYSGNPFVIMAGESSTNIFNKKALAENLFLEGDKKSEPSYVRKYHCFVEEENRAFLEEAYDQSFIADLDTPKNASKKLFKKPVEQCDFVLLEKVNVPSIDSFQPVVLNSEDLSEPKNETKKEYFDVDKEEQELEPASKNTSEFFEKGVEVLPVLKTEDSGEAFLMLLEICSQTLQFDEQETFELWLYSFYKEASLIENLPQKDIQEGLIYLFNAAQTTFEKDIQMLQQFAGMKTK